MNILNPPSQPRWIFLSTIKNITPQTHTIQLSKLSEEIVYPCDARIGKNPEFGIPCEINKLNAAKISLKGWDKLDEGLLKNMVGESIWVKLANLTFPPYFFWKNVSVKDIDGLGIGITTTVKHSAKQVFLVIKTPKQEIELPFVSKQFEITYLPHELKNIVCKMKKQDLEDIYGEL